MRVHIRTAALPLVALALATACGGPGSPGSAAATSGTAGAGDAVSNAAGTAASGAASPSAAVTPQNRFPVRGVCGPPSAPGRLLHFRASDGVRLRAATAGSGQRGVVLVPELGRAAMCGWWDYEAYLSRAGYHVLMFDHRCTGASACPAGRAAQEDLMADIRGAVAWLRHAGAVKVVLVGGSQGAAEVVIAGTRPPRAVTAVVALSADELTMALARAPYPRTAFAAAPKLRLPALFGVAAGDPNVSVPETRQLVARVSSEVKRLVVLPAGSGHGWDLVVSASLGGPRPAFSHTVEAFLARATS